MGSVSINGKHYQVPDGACVSVIGNKVFVNGKPYADATDNTLTIKWEGTAPESLVVQGDNVRVECGDITGNVECQGSVTCKNIAGNLRAGGSVTCDNVGADLRAGGSVNCDDVSGSVSAQGSVSADCIKGSVRAGGSISR